MAMGTIEVLRVRRISINFTNSLRKRPESAFMFLIYPLKHRRINGKEHWHQEDYSNVAETIHPDTDCVLRQYGSATDNT